MKYSLVIFDLDGTILNTLEDLAEAVNHALENAGHPTRTTEEVRRFIGNGAARLIRLSLPEGADQAEQEAVLKEFKTWYNAHVNVHTKPYTGMPGLLGDLKAAGIAVAVNSNKPDDAVDMLCRAHYDGLFAMTRGEVAGVPKKPAPDGALAIMNALGVPAERTLYVGDGDADILTARNAGIDGAWVSWGYRRREELEGLDIPRAFESVEQLRHFLLGD